MKKTKYSDAREVTSIYESALKAFKKAVELESLNSDYYIAVARVHLERGASSETLNWCEKAIVADNSTDLGDFETLLFMSMIHMRSGNLAGVQTGAKRILDLVPAEDQEAKKYVAFRFVEFGAELAKMGALKPASACFEAALQFDPDDQKLKEARRFCVAAIREDKEWETLKDDAGIVPPVVDPPLQHERTYGRPNQNQPPEGLTFRARRYESEKHGAPHTGRSMSSTPSPSQSSTALIAVSARILTKRCLP